MADTPAVRILIREGVDDATAFTALRKAMEKRLPESERQAAEQEFEQLQAEFTDDIRKSVEIYRIACADEGMSEENRQRQRNVVEWQLDTHYRTGYRDALILGKRMAGSDKRLATNETEMIRRVAANERQYSLNLLDDIETGEMYMDLDRRVELYGNALEEMKWMGFLYADLSADRYLRWVTGESEHCVDCMFLAGRLEDLKEDVLDAADGNPTEAQEELLEIIDAHLDTQGGRWGNGTYRAQELATMAILPQSGKLRCTTNCRCHLEETDRPDSKPEGKEAKEPFESLRPKTPTMLNRETKQAERQRYAERADTWKQERVLRTEPEELEPYR